MKQLMEWNGEYTKGPDDRYQELTWHIGYKWADIIDDGKVEMNLRKRTHITDLLFKGKYKFTNMKRLWIPKPNIMSRFSLDRFKLAIPSESGWIESSDWGMPPPHQSLLVINQNLQLSP